MRAVLRGKHERFREQVARGPVGRASSALPRGFAAAGFARSGNPCPIVSQLALYPMPVDSTYGACRGLHHGEAATKGGSHAEVDRRRKMAFHGKGPEPYAAIRQAKGDNQMHIVKRSRPRAHLPASSRTVAGILPRSFPAHIEAVDRFDSPPLSDVWWTAPTILATHEQLFPADVHVDVFDVDSGLVSKNAVAGNTADVGLVAGLPLIAGYSQQRKSACPVQVRRILSAIGARWALLPRSPDIGSSRSGKVEPVAIVAGTISELYLVRLAKTMPLLGTSDPPMTLRGRPPDATHFVENGSASSCIHLGAVCLGTLCQALDSGEIRRSDVLTVSLYSRCVRCFHS